MVKAPRPLDPGNSRSDVLWQESNMLQQLAGISGVPRVLDQGWDATKQNTAIIMQPLGVVLQWKVWSSSTRKTPLHTLMAPLVTTLGAQPCAQLHQQGPETKQHSACQW